MFSDKMSIFVFTVVTSHKEYADIGWHTKEEVLAGDFHPVLKQVWLSSPNWGWGGGGGGWL